MRSSPFHRLRRPARGVTVVVVLVLLSVMLLAGICASNFILNAYDITAALLFPRWRQRYGRDQFVRVGTAVHAVASLVVVFSGEVWIAVPAMIIVGMAWISTANSLTLAAQMALPNWVRARGMSIYQMALMGGSAAGAALWGQVASWTSVATSILSAAIAGPLVLLLTRRLSVDGGEDEEGHDLGDDHDVLDLCRELRPYHADGRHGRGIAGVGSPDRQFKRHSLLLCSHILMHLTTAVGAATHPHRTAASTCAPVRKLVALGHGDGASN